MKILSMPAVNGMSLDDVYKNGVWRYGYDNPGSYVWSGVTVSACTLAADHINVVNSSDSTMKIIGTSSLVDLTGYTTLHFKCRINSGTGAICIATSYTKNNPAGSGYYRYVKATGGATYIDYAVDITGIPSAYIFIWAQGNVNADVNEIYLS